MCSDHYSMRMYARNGAARFPVLVVTGSNSAEQMPLKAHSNLTPVRHAHVSVAVINERHQQIYQHICPYIAAIAPLARSGMRSREATSFTQNINRARARLRL